LQVEEAASHCCPRPAQGRSAAQPAQPPAGHEGVVQRPAAQTRPEPGQPHWAEVVQTAQLFVLVLQ
jgi:hypothetical protein